MNSRSKAEFQNCCSVFRLCCLSCVGVWAGGSRLTAEVWESSHDESLIPNKPGPCPQTRLAATPDNACAGTTGLGDEGKTVPGIHRDLGYQIYGVVGSGFRFRVRVIRVWCE